MYATLKDVGALLGSLKEQADGLVPIDELRELLEQERAWLQEAQRTLSQVRDLRANELRRLRTSRVAQWVAALAFALASAVAVGAGYAWVTKPYATELSELRARQEFGDSDLRTQSIRLRHPLQELWRRQLSLQLSYLGRSSGRGSQR